MNGRHVNRVRQPVDHEVTVPGSKSVANRAIMCSVLASGASVLVGVPDGDDTRLMIQGCRVFGASIRVDGDVISIQSGIDRSDSDPTSINAGLGGTTSRFLTALAATRVGTVTVTGDLGLQKRPMADLHDALHELGVSLFWHGASGALPVTVSDGPVQGGTVTVSAEASSQFASALVLAAPAMSRGLRLNVPSPRVSSGYLDMSIMVAREFGAKILVEGDSISVDFGGYQGRVYHVEPDASSASFVFAVPAIVGGRVVVPGMGRVTMQPERLFPNVLRKMGCTVEIVDSSLVVSRDPREPLRGVDIDMSAMSDAVPILAAIATRATSPSRIRGVGFIRDKESNRIDGLAGELRKVGAEVAVETDGLSIIPGTPRSAIVNTLGDHRIAMAFGVLGLAGGNVIIQNPEVVAKSWPSFWEVLDRFSRP